MGNGVSKMKAIQTKAIITSIRAKVDGSLGFSGTTPELSTEEKVAFMELQNNELDCLFAPTGIPNAPKMNVEGEVKGKSASTRLYNVLYVWWEQQGRPDDFEVFYKKHMEKFIDIVKGQLI